MGGVLLSQPSICGGGGGGAEASAAAAAAPPRPDVSAKATPAAAAAGAAPGLEELIVCRLDAEGPFPMPPALVSGALQQLLPGPAGGGRGGGGTCDAAALLLLQPEGGEATLGEGASAADAPSALAALVSQQPGAALGVAPSWQLRHSLSGAPAAAAAAHRVTLLSLPARPRPSAADAAPAGTPLQKRPRLTGSIEGGGGAGAAAAAAVVSELSRLACLCSCWRALRGGNEAEAGAPLPLHCEVALRALSLAAACTRFCV
jgi:hypothetical protein